MKLSFDTIIIGAGVSGMSAAIYLKRAGLSLLLLEKNYPGGQLNRANKIENYPGIIEIDGPTLAFNMVEQLNKLSIDVTYENVVDIIDNGEYKVVKTNIGEYMAKTILLATGRIPRELELENEKFLVGRGISWCASCDGPLYKGKIVAVVGGGNTAINDALYLSNICKKVYVINRTNKYRAENTNLDKARKKENIEFVENRIIKELNVEEDKLAAIVLDDNTILTVDGLFEAIGSIPNIDYLKSIDIKTLNDYIIVNEKMETSVKGIYASGDAIKKDLYQVVTANSEGAIAANAIIQYLK